MAKNGIVKHKMVIIGGSAGSLDIITKIISSLPINTKTSFIIIIHRKNSNDSILVNLLSSKTRLKVKEVEDKDVINPGCIYIAPPDYHLLLEDEKNFSLDVSEKVQFSRPSIDVSFESAAEVFQSALIGILLSGANADGANGIKCIASYGGYTIVQDPATAEVPYMPAQAIKKTKVDLIADGAKIGEKLKELIDF